MHVEQLKQIYVNMGSCQNPRYACLSLTSPLRFVGHLSNFPFALSRWERFKMFPLLMLFRIRSTIYIKQNAMPLNPIMARL